MEYINFIRSMIDFGLVVLIWLVQLIIYPGFAIGHPQYFERWHRKYMFLITFVVAPLMFAQLAMVGFQLWIHQSTLTVISAFLVLSVWLHTFAKAVPLHNALTENGNKKVIVESLVNANWFRTAVWTALWLTGLFLW